MTSSGIELTDEEFQLAIANRPKVPLNAHEVDDLREVISWWKTRREEAEKGQKRWERWSKRFPVIFGAIGAMTGLAGLFYNFTRK